MCFLSSSLSFYLHSLVSALKQYGLTCVLCALCVCVGFRFSLVPYFALTQKNLLPAFVLIALIGCLFVIVVAAARAFVCALAACYFPLTYFHGTFFQPIPCGLQTIRA